MVEDIIDRWKKMSLSKVEKSKVSLPCMNNDSMLHYSSQCLLFKLHTRKFFNKEAFKTMMHTMWNLVRDMWFFI